jgi:hypothetical protein
MRYVFYSTLGILIFWILAGLCVGAYFSHPNAEDFSLVNRPRDFGNLKATVELLMNFDGRYFTNILHGINPLRYGWVAGYKIMPIIAVIFLSFSVFYFFCSLRIRQAHKVEMLTFSFLLVGLFLTFTPSIVHTLYWMVSSFVFFYPWGFFFLFLGSFIRMETAKSPMNALFYQVMSFSFLFLTTGMNEMFLPVTLISVIFLAVLSGYNRELIRYAPIIIVGLSSIYLFMSSPGILNRMEILHNELPTITLLHKIKLSITGFLNEIISFLFAHIASVPLVAAIHIYLRVGKKIIIGATPKKLFLIVMAIGAFLYAMTLPYFLVMASPEIYPQRVYSSVHFGFTLLFFIVLPIVLLGIKLPKMDYLKPDRGYATASFLVVLTLILYNIFPNNITLIRGEYIAGTLQGFSGEMEERYSALFSTREASCRETVLLQPLKNKPISICHEPDIEVNREYEFWNNAYEYYFNVYEVGLVGDSVRKIRTTEILSQFK